MKSEYWDGQCKQPTFKDFLDCLEGCIICRCDHGCNQWVIENSAKTLHLMKAQQEGVSTEKLDEICQKHAKEFIDILWETLLERDPIL